MERQLRLNDERVKLRDKFKRALPDLMIHEDAVLDSVYKDSAFSDKVKRLISLDIALRAGCVNCILSQTTQALEAEASKDEVLETLSVELAQAVPLGLANH